MPVVTSSPRPHRPRLRAVPLVLAAGLLAGCGGGGLEGMTTMLGGGGAGGATVSPVGPSTIAGVSVDQLRADQLCPGVTVRDGTETLRLYDPDMAQGPSAVRFQAQILQTAVECTPAGGQYGLTVGVAGRALIGPRGAPASLDLPVRIVVLNRNDGSVVSSELVRTAAVIEPTEVSAPFTIVRSGLFIPVPARQADYTVLVGFDSAS